MVLENWWVSSDNALNQDVEEDNLLSTAVYLTTSVIYYYNITEWQVYWDQEMPMSLYLVLHQNSSSDTVLNKPQKPART